MCLFINGVFRQTLQDIEETQHRDPKQVCYLQPYSSYRIKLLAKGNPTPESPIRLYLSLTDSLNLISYRAKIVGWRDIRELKKEPTALALVEQNIKKFQKSENGIGDGVNLISILDLTRLAKDEKSGTASEEEQQFSVLSLIKTRDEKPRKKRTRAGGWSEVRKQTLPT